MRITPLNNLADFSLPLPVYTSVHIADAICKQGEEYNILIGIEKKYAEQLKKLSLDESDIDLQNNTGDRRRFGEGSYEEWYEKNRTPFILVHKQTDKLAALIWFGPKSLGKKSLKFGEEEKDKVQNNWHTAVWRSYPAFRGRGFMKDFTQFAMEVYKKQFPGIGFWAGMDNRNTATIMLSTKLGFEIDLENSDLSANWLVAIKK